MAMRFAAYAGGNTFAPANAALTSDNSVEDTITAHAGGTQAAAYALTAAVNRVTIVASAGDSVALPLAALGMSILVINDDLSGSTSMTVYGSGTDTVNNVATATGVALAAAKCCLYTVTKAAPGGNWATLLSA